MDVARERRILELLDGALGRPAEERLSWVAANAAGDQDVASAVIALLDREDSARSLLPTERSAAEAEMEFVPPERVGAYRLSGLLGEGGMSRVYLGERDDGLFEHQVAVKFMRPTYLDQRARDLFDTERRALAKLRHPNIATLIDGGIDATGSPYLVMEFVVGVPIDRYVADRRLSSESVARLFLQVCDAARAAHQSLIAHGDIKPANILVDPEGRARLLDFGVAQMLGDAGAATGSIGEGAYPVTTAYASPQRMQGARPSVGDDIYALGILLRAMRSAAAGVGAPVASSDRERALDAVCAMATASEATARYAGVDALMGDVQRWLARRPVAAMSPDWRSHVSAFIGRHPLAVLAASLAVAGLIATSAVMTGLYAEARRERALAENRFEQVRGLAKYLLFDLYDHLDRTPQSLRLRQDVARRGQAYLDNLARDAAASDALHVETIEGFLRLAAVQGAPGKSNLGDLVAARSNLAKSVELARALVARRPGAPQAWLALARALSLASDFAENADHDVIVGERDWLASQDALAKAQRVGAATPTVQSLAVETAIVGASLRGWQGRYAEESALGQQALDGWRALPPVVKASEMGRLTAARAWSLVAEGAYYRGDAIGAERGYREQTSLTDALVGGAGNDPIALRAAARADWELGTTLIEFGKPALATATLAAGARLAQHLIDLDSEDSDALRDLRILRLAQAQALAANHRYLAAIALMSSQVAEREAFARSHPDQVQALRDLAVGRAALGDILASANRKYEACRAYAMAKTDFGEVSRRGRLTGVDVTYAVKQMVEHQHATCH